MRHFVDDDYDSMEEYESGIFHSKAKESRDDSYDKSTFPPIHLDDDYDSMADYEKSTFPPIHKDD